MSGTDADTAQDEAGPHRTRTHEFLVTCREVARAWADPFVDVAAVASIAAVVWAAPDPALAQVAVGGISSVAVGKRYLGRKGAAP